MKQTMKYYEVTWTDPIDEMWETYLKSKGKDKKQIKEKLTELTKEENKRLQRKVWNTP